MLMIRVMTFIRTLLPVLFILSAPGFAADWNSVHTPVAGPPRAIGDFAAGCMAGAVALPSDGPGFQVIRASRSRFWGQPSTIANIQTLGALVQRAGLPDMYIGDLSQARGGPMNGGHASHQIGLDADIWFDMRPKPRLAPNARENIDVPSLVRADQRGINPAVFQPAHTQLLQIAATMPDTDRIFVHFAIKRHLCQTVTGDRSWLRRLRPWWGHASHFHIRYRCPAGQPDCRAQAPIPAGDGCDASLQWWFDQLDAPPDPRPRRPSRPVLPAACDAILAAP